MNDHDEQFEAFLREFQPARPRALAEVSVGPNRLLRRLAAAVVLFAGCTLSAWFAGHTRSSTSSVPQAAAPAPDETGLRRPSLTALTQLALQDPRRLDNMLDAQSRVVLPRFDQPQSTLRVLAKE